MESLKKSIIGAWSLETCELRDGEGNVSYPFGQNAVGKIVYTADKRIFVAIMNPDRGSFASDDFMRGTDEEKIRAAEGFASYYGTYEIRDNVVIHSVEMSFFPNWVGQSLERFVEIEGDSLRLSTTPFGVDGKDQSALVVWRRN